MPFDILVACTKNGGIGKNGTIPWYLPPDLKWFQNITCKTADPSKKNAVIMGKNTWNSLPKKPLANRRNIVLTTSSMEDEYKHIIANGGEIYHSLEDALAYLGLDQSIENIFVIGGEILYKRCIYHSQCRNIYITLIDNEYDCDTYFPINELQYAKFVKMNISNKFVFKDICYSSLTYMHFRYT